MKFNFSGIGKATAIDFAKRGAKVILACRDLIKANKTKGTVSCSYLEVLS